MVKVREIVEKIHSRRKALNLKVRQPLAKVTVKAGQLNSQLGDLILAETNIKKIKFNENITKEIILDTKLTSALKAEGLARDLIRVIQEARKQAKTELNELINLELPAWPEAFEAEIKQKTYVKKIVKGKQLKVIRL
jgi:isoleucyl-tRNA synthetase